MGIIKSSLSSQNTNLDPSPNTRGTKFTGTPRAGIRVDEYNAMAYSAVWCAVRVLTGFIMSCPCRVYRSLPKGGCEQVHDTVVSSIFEVGPNEEMEVKGWIRGQFTNELLWGNDYGEILKARKGTVAGVIPLDPSRVNPARDSNDRLVYDISDPRQPNYTLPPDRVFHPREMGPNPLIGWSPIRMAREAISLGLAAERFGAAFFGNGVTPSMIFQHPKIMGDVAQKNFRESVEAYRNDTAKSRGILVVEEDMKVVPVTMPMEDAQFLETRTFQVNDIGPRIYGVPSAWMGDYDKAKFSNMEQMQIQLHQGGIVPRVTAYEAEANWKLLTPDERAAGMYVKFNTNAILRGDIKTRGEFYKIMTGCGAYHPNRVLELEDENPIGPEGDTRLVPMNMVSLETAYREGRTGGTTEASTPINISTKQSDDEDDNNAGERALEPVFRDAICVLVSKEIMAVSRKMEKSPDEESLVKWMISFYDDHEQHICERLSSVCDAYSGLCKVDKRLIFDRVKSFAGTWVVESRERLGKTVFSEYDQLRSEWTRSREGQLYERLMIDLEAVRQYERRHKHAA